MAGCFTEPDAARDNGLEHTIPEKTPDFLDDLARQIGPLVVHGDGDPDAVEAGIQRLPDPLYGVHGLRNALQGQEFGLDRDQDGIGGDQGVDGDQPQGGRTVDQDVVEPVAQSLQEAPQLELALRLIHQFDLDPDQLPVGGDHR